MSIEYKKNLVNFKDVVSVDEAEGLLEWLQKKTTAKVDFTSCTHIHPANLQVLMAAKPIITAWPADPVFGVWLKSALGQH